MAVSTATVSITVQGTVSAGNDSFSTDAETAVTFSIADLLANDTANGAPATLDLVEFAIVSQPANGTLVDNGDGTLTYTPDAGFCGPDPFEYEITNICQEEPEPEPGILCVAFGEDAMPLSGLEEFSLTVVCISFTENGSTRTLSAEYSTQHRRWFFYPIMCGGDGVYEPSPGDLVTISQGSLEQTAVMTSGAYMTYDGETGNWESGPFYFGYGVPVTVETSDGVFTGHYPDDGPFQWDDGFGPENPFGFDGGALPVTITVGDDAPVCGALIWPFIGT